MPDRNAMEPCSCHFPIGALTWCLILLLSDQIRRSVVSDSLWPHESQHTRPPCPSQTPRIHSDSRPSSRWCHPAISSCRPLLFLPPIPPSIRVFSNESTLHMRWPKYWSFSFSILPSKEIPGLVSFRMDWLDLLIIIYHYSLMILNKTRVSKLQSHHHHQTTVTILLIAARIGPKLVTS